MNKHSNYGWGVFILGIRYYVLQYYEEESQQQKTEEQVMPNGKKITKRSTRPDPIGPFSQAVQVGDHIYCSAQLPLHPNSGEVVGSTAKEQAELAMQNLVAALSAASSGLPAVFKVTIYIRSEGHLAAAADVCDSYFLEGEGRPVVTWVVANPLKL
jgi:2-iminobutanoate/2-iminopropanoate deaminase